MTWQVLRLDENQVGDEGMVKFAEALGNGALPLLITLELSFNSIGNDGMCSLSDALGKGALPKCSDISLFGNPGNHELVQKALHER